MKLKLSIDIDRKTFLSLAKKMAENKPITSLEISEMIGSESAHIVEVSERKTTLYGIGASPVATEVDTENSFVNAIVGFGISLKT